VVIVLLVRLPWLFLSRLLILSLACTGHSVIQSPESMVDKYISNMSNEQAKVDEWGRLVDGQCELEPSVPFLYQLMLFVTPQRF
jgi:hypothetical protein